MSSIRIRLLDVAALALLTLATFVANGYAFGVDDHAIHLVFIERAVDPGFLPGDLLAEASGAHASLFFMLVALPARVLDIEVVFAILHVITIALMLAGAASLARAAFPEEDPRITGGVAALLAAVGSATFAQIPTFDHLLLPRTAVLGGELFALSFALRGQFTFAFAICGALFNLHATTASHTAVIVFALAIVHRTRMRAATLGPLAFVAAASPLLVLMMLQPADGGGDRTLWREAVTLHFPLHHFVAWFGKVQWVCLLVPVAVALAASRAARSVGVMGAAVLITCIAAYAAIEWTQLPAAVELHLYESTRLLSFVAFASAGGLVARAWAQGRLRRALAAALTLALCWFGAVSSVTLLDENRVDFWVATACVLALACVHLLARPGGDPGHSRPPARPAAFIVLAFAALAAAMVARHIRGPAAAVAPRFADAHRLGMCWEYPDPQNRIDLRARCGFPLMQWAGRHLAGDAVVATPPYFIHPLTNFRVAARRTVLVTFKDGGEATFSPHFAEHWTERLATITGSNALLVAPPPSLRSFVSRFFALHAGYAETDLTRLRSLRRAYGVTHALLPVYAPAAALPLPVIYEDAAFRLVSIEEL